MFFYLWKTLENSKHKCTHFNIINIIWLPLYHPHSPGFYLPVAAGGEMETLSQHQPGKTASDDGRRDVGHWVLCPCSHHLHPRGGEERGPGPGGTARLSVPRGRVKAGALATWFLSPLVALLGPQAPWPSQSSFWARRGLSAGHPGAAVMNRSGRQDGRGGECRFANSKERWRSLPAIPQEPAPPSKQTAAPSRAHRLHLTYTSHPEHT